MSALVRGGATWPVLLEAWLGDDSADASSAPVRAARAEAAAELATTLCFWCAHPSLAPPPGLPGGVRMSAAATVLVGTEPDPCDVVLSALRLRGGRDGEEAQGQTKSARSATAEVLAHLGSTVPHLPQRVGSRLAQALLEAPQMPDIPLPMSRILSRGLAYLLRGAGDALWNSSTWDLLYADWRDGRAFGSLLRCVLHYRSQAVLVVRTVVAGEVFGALADCWEEGNGTFGGSAECLLLSLLPVMQVYRPTGKSKNFVYLNSRSKRAPRGLGFGGQVGSFRLWLGADMEECQALGTDVAFDAGPLTAPGREGRALEISQIEVWGLGGEAARAAQRTRREELAVRP